MDRGFARPCLSRSLFCFPASEESASRTGPAVGSVSGFVRLLLHRTAFWCRDLEETWLLQLVPSRIPFERLGRGVLYPRRGGHSSSGRHDGQALVGDRKKERSVRNFSKFGAFPAHPVILRGQQSPLPPAPTYRFYVDH